MLVTIAADLSPAQVLEEVAAHMDRESGRLHGLAALTTGRERKDREAQAAYATQAARFWRTVQVAPCE